MLTDFKSKEELHTIRFEKVGLLIPLLRHSYECLKILLIPRSEHSWSKNLLTHFEVLELALVLGHESTDLWQHLSTFDKQAAGDQPQHPLGERLLNMTESAFVGSSLAVRYNFLRLLFRVCPSTSSDTFLSSLLAHSSSLRLFLEWTLSQKASSCSDAHFLEVRTLAKAVAPLVKGAESNNNPNRDSEFSRLDYLGRFRPQKIESALIDQVNAGAKLLNQEDQQQSQLESSLGQGNGNVNERS